MIDALCEAVRDQLNAAATANAFSPTFQVAIDDAPEFDIEDLADLTVTMLPFGANTEEASRAHDKEVYTMDIAFQQHAEQPPATGADPIVAMTRSLRNLQQSVSRWLSIRANRIPPGYLTAKLTKIEQTPLYDHGLLRTERVYVGVLRLTYEAVERLS